jgi:hypothetical protein
MNKSVYQLYQELIDMNTTTAICRMRTMPEGPERTGVLISAAIYEARTREIMDLLPVEEVA